MTRNGPDKGAKNGKNKVYKKQWNSKRIQAWSLGGNVILGWIHGRVPIPLDLAVITRWNSWSVGLRQFWHVLETTICWRPLLCYHAKRTKDWLLHHVSQPYRGDLIWVSIGVSRAGNTPELLKWGIFRSGITSSCYNFYLYTKGYVSVWVCFHWMAQIRGLDNLRNRCAT